MSASLQHSYLLYLHLLRDNLRIAEFTLCSARSYAFLFVLWAPGTELQVSSMQSRHTTSELHPLPLLFCDSLPKLPKLVANLKPFCLSLPSRWNDMHVHHAWQCTVLWIFTKTHKCAKHHRWSWQRLIRHYHWNKFLGEFLLEIRIKFLDSQQSWVGGPTLKIFQNYKYTSFHFKEASW